MSLKLAYCAFAIVLTIASSTANGAYPTAGCATLAMCPATDVNCDDLTDGFDIAIIRNPANWLMSPGEADEPRADVNGDGVIDGFDIAVVRSPACWLRSGLTETRLAGNALAEFPFFEYVRAFNEDAGVEVAIDPTRFPDIVGLTCDIYVVESKSRSEWTADPALSDATPDGAQTQTFGGTTIQDNTFTVGAPFELDPGDGLELGKAYDVVLDCDQDGSLSSGDYVDGFDEEASLYVLTDITTTGPLAVTEITYSGGAWLGQRTYYPTDLASLGQLPLVTIAHGGGHAYTWYGDVGRHLASYGCIVMAHQTNNGPGIETSSTTVLINTDFIIGEQASIGGGVLDGHIDSHHIVWVGQSRGGEGVVRAYDRIFEGSFTPEHFQYEDIALVSSMVPTDFLGPAGANPHGVNYHLWTGSSDADVTGAPQGEVVQTFHLHDRAIHSRHSTVIQGAGNGDFHDFGSSVATGPCLIGRDNVHLILKGLFLPLIRYYTGGSIPATDFFWRQWERFHPIGAPDPGFCPASGGPAIVVNNTFRPRGPAVPFVIDDYQSNPDANLSSSGGAVTFDVQNLTEDRLDDNDASFDWTPTDPMNGMTYGSAVDDTRGVVFDWNDENRFYEQQIIPSERDFSDNGHLSFRACQGTRHPYTTAELGDLTFTVTLRDGAGTTSSINIGVYGGGIEEPYQRTGAGVGIGWHNEFETIRIRLTDFLNNGSGLDLTDVEAIQFQFGPGYGSTEGRVGMDDIQLSDD